MRGPAGEHPRVYHGSESVYYIDNQKDLNRDLNRDENSNPYIPKEKRIEPRTATQTSLEHSLGAKSRRPAEPPRDVAEEAEEALATEAASTAVKAAPESERAE